MKDVPLTHCPCWKELHWLYHGQVVDSSCYFRAKSCYVHILPIVSLPPADSWQNACFTQVYTVCHLKCLLPGTWKCSLPRNNFLCVFLVAPSSWKETTSIRPMSTTGKKKKYGQNTNFFLLIFPWAFLGWIGIP